MKKLFIMSICGVMLITSCGTYTGTGAYTGTLFGSILGSAIGGIAGGPRGSDIGTVIGMAGGAIVGAGIGAAADQKAEEDVHRHYEAVQRRKAQVMQRDSYSNSGFDSSNSGDDRLYDFSSSDYTGTYSASSPQYTLPAASSVVKIAPEDYTFNPQIEIQNARVVDQNQDNSIGRNEVCKVIFEVRNLSSETLYDVVPTVVEATGNKHIQISPSVHVESIEPGGTIRYTAMLQSDGRINDGTIKICLSVLQGGNTISKVAEFTVRTRRN